MDIPHDWGQQQPLTQVPLEDSSLQQTGAPGPSLLKPFSTECAFLSLGKAEGQRTKGPE